MPPKASNPTYNGNNYRQANYTDNSDFSAPYSNSGTYYVNPNRNYQTGASTANFKNGNAVVAIILCIFCPIAGIIYCAVAKPFKTEGKTTLCAILTGVWMMVLSALSVWFAIWFQEYLLDLTQERFEEETISYDDIFSTYDQSWDDNGNGTYTCRNLVISDLGVEKDPFGNYYLTGYLKNDSELDYNCVDITFYLYDDEGFFVETVSNYTSVLPKGETQKLYISCGVKDFTNAKPINVSWDEYNERSSERWFIF